MLMAAVAYNLKKVLNHKSPKVLAMVKSIKENRKMATKLCFCIERTYDQYNGKFSFQN
jgi:hypothetical protein